jgi:hypothetical protein
MPQKKKLVTEYKWHRVPQYARGRSQEAGRDSASASPSQTQTSGSTPRDTLTSSPSDQPPESSSSSSHRSPGYYNYPPSHLFGNKVDAADDSEKFWSFTAEENVEADVLDVVGRSSRKSRLVHRGSGADNEVDRRRSTWILVDDPVDSDGKETASESDEQFLKDEDYTMIDVVLIGGEIPLEAVILPKDRARLDLQLFWKDEDKFLKEIPIFLHIQVRNWVAVHGDATRAWHIPTTLHTWWGEWNTFLGYYRDSSYWIYRYPSYLPGKYAWDSAISSHSAMESYYNMRQVHKGPTYLSWTCEGIDAREEARNIMWSCECNAADKK